MTAHDALDHLLARAESHLARLGAAPGPEESALLAEHGIDPDTWADPLGHGAAGLAALATLMAAVTRPNP